METLKSFMMVVALVVIIVLVIGGGIGYCENIIKLSHMNGDSATLGLFVVRAIGIVVFPVGIAAGLLW